MSSSNIPVHIKAILMGKCGGKCEFRGCEKNILSEVLTKKSGIFSNYAHIIADRPNGPRGDKILSPILGEDESNIMILCFDHHKLIDSDVEEYTVQKLKDMKTEHEEFIKSIMKTHKEKKITAIKYSSSISDRIPVINDNDIRMSIKNQELWCHGNILDLSGSKYDETSNKSFYEFEKENLKRTFKEIVKPVQKRDECAKFSLFAIASQPLLIYLGTLFSDIANVEVQQLQREPKSEWRLSDDDCDDFEINIIMPPKNSSKVALNISITADISEERIIKCIGKEYDIVKIESNIHGNNIITSKKQLEKFRVKIREAYEKIKDVYGRNCEINIFPAMPLSIAIETGRCWMKKAHPKLIIYDEKSGFEKTLEIQYEREE